MLPLKLVGSIHIQQFITVIKDVNDCDYVFIAELLDSEQDIVNRSFLYIGTRE